MNLLINKVLKLWWRLQEIIKRLCNIVRNVWRRRKSSFQA